MATIPIWLTGPGGAYTVSVTPQTVSNAGLLADTTPVATLTGSIDEVDISFKSITEEISAMTSGRQNNVQLQVATSVKMTEILKTSANLLATAINSASIYFKCIITRAGQTWTFYGLIESYDESLRRGKSTGVANFIMVDPATANPTYV